MKCEGCGKQVQRRCEVNGKVGWSLLPAFVGSCNCTPDGNSELRRKGSRVMGGTCKVEDCGRIETRLWLGMCQMHYRRVKQHGDPNFVQRRGRCSLEGCERPHYGHGLCNLHWQRSVNRGSTDDPPPSKGSGTPEYEAWRKAISRCYDPSNSQFKHYGARGIIVCDRWRDSFASFLSDMGKRPSSGHSLDRVNNDGHYEAENCRWATTEEQQGNRRNAVNLTIDGETKCAAQWALVSGINETTIKRRARAGMNHRDAVFAPPDETRTFQERGLLSP